MGEANGRELFPVLERRVFLNWASLSPFMVNAAKAAQEMVEQALLFERGSVNNEWTSMSERARRETAVLLHTTSDRIAFAGTSTTQAIHSALLALDIQPGQEMLVGDAEFPSVAGMLASLMRKGVKVRIARGTGGKYPQEEIENLLTHNTRAAIISSVNWITGRTNNIREIAEIVHQQGCYLIVDAVQHLGALPLDAEKSGADFICAGTQKWLLNPAGKALLYASKRAVEELSTPFPPLTSFGVREGGWDEFFGSPGRDFFPGQVKPGNTTFFDAPGWHNHIASATLLKSLELLNQIGDSTRAKRIHVLQEKLLEQMASTGAEPLFNDGNERSGIITFSFHSRVNGVELVRKLREEGIDVSWRGGNGLEGLRFAVHCFNNAEDIDKAVEGTRRCLPMAAIDR
ncbi:MAG: aminotransferase class V-fold PLP-dependent enzyme [Methanomassiliicoccales archaeon]